MLSYVWIAPLLPFLAFATVLFLGKRLPGKGAYVAISAIGLSFVYSMVALAQVVGGARVELDYTWLTVGRVSLSVGVKVDQLTAVMLVVVTSVALLVEIYSLGYMKGDKRFSWYYAAISLFTAAMLSLVIANNYLQLYVSWELVGLCSYLLIGFWYEKKAASNAAMKAFLTTRVGDVGFFLGLAALFVAAGTFNFTALSRLIEAGRFAPTFLTGVAILLFCGAAGKSAQVPLHVWLPDAMEGPTPVSALIHAATMVAAGVYLVARSFFIFEAALPMAFAVVAVVGTITALMAATIALAMSDIKKILAYSTISQLGFMMAVLGMGGYVAGAFHLMTHAFFKALLFLGAGSVIHGTGTQNIYEMGGLAKKMKVTMLTFLVASLSIAGIFPLSGFWSKDEILAQAWHGGHYVILSVLLFTAFLTAFYMFRLCFLVFFGKPRRELHAHESPPSMTYPLILLAVPAALAGLVGSPFMGGAFISFLEGKTVHLEPNYVLMAGSFGVALLGIAAAWAMFLKGWVKEKTLRKRFAFAYHILENKYYFDRLYQAALVRPIVGLSGFLNRFDWRVVDGVARGASAMVLRTAGTSGQIDRGVDRMPGLLTRVVLFIGKIAVWFDKRVIEGLVHAVGGGTVAAGEETEVFESKVVDRLVIGLGALVKKTSEKVRKAHTGNLLNYTIYIFLAEILAIIIALLIAWYTR